MLYGALWLLLFVWLVEGEAKGKKYFDFMGLSNSGRENLLIAKNISLPLEEAGEKNFRCDRL